MARATLRSILSLSIAAVAPAVTTAAVIYVDQDATGPVHDGQSWCTAYQTLTPALQAAGPGDSVRVAGGVYTPDTTGLLDPRTATFKLPGGVTIAGAYAGCGAPNPDARDYANDISFITGNLPNGIDRCYHVLTATNASAVVLDGLYIDAGRADNPFIIDGLNGAGLLATASSITGINVIFQGNEAVEGPDGTLGRGGAVYLRSSKASFVDSLFRESIGGQAGAGVYLENSFFGDDGSWFAGDITAGDGGGLYIDERSSAALRGSRFLACNAGNYASPGRGGCIFNRGELLLVLCNLSGNGALNEGGAIYNYKAHADLVSCTIGYQLAAVGGQLYNLSSSVTLMNCLVTDGYATAGAGGGILNNASKLSITNCTIANNSSTVAAAGVDAIGVGGGVSIYNSILWGNTANGVQDEAAQVRRDATTSLAVNYSDVQGLTGALGGVGNIGGNPLFVGAGDYHLSAFSPCISAGLNAAVPADIGDLDLDGNTLEQTPYDLDGNPRIIGRRVDMGAYEQ